MSSSSTVLPREEPPRPSRPEGPCDHPRHTFMTTPPRSPSPLLFPMSGCGHGQARLRAAGLWPLQRPGERLVRGWDWSSCPLGLDQEASCQARRLGDVPWSSEVMSLSSSLLGSCQRGLQLPFPCRACWVLSHLR